MNKKIEKKDGYYWIATSNTSKTGYPSLHALFADNFVYGWIGIGLLGLSALLQIAVFILRVANL